VGGKITKHFRNYQIISKEYSKEFSFETNKAPTIGHPERNQGISLDEKKKRKPIDFRFFISHLWGTDQRPVPLIHPLIHSALA
jgi:preprotein translocase subunit SecB